MHLTALDERLQALGLVAERVAANLLDLEQDPTRRLLDTASLTGSTAASWAEANETLRSLWQCYTHVIGVLDHARSVRDASDTPDAATAAQLSMLLDGPAVSIDLGTRPIHERSLLGERGNVERLSVDETIARMAGGFDRIRTVIGSAARTWHELAPRLTTAREHIDALRALDGPCRAPGNDGSDALATRIGTTVVQAMADPLSVTEADVQAIEREVVVLADERRSDDAFAREFAARMSDAHRLLDETRLAAADADTVARTVAPKFITEELPALDDEPASLATALAAVESLVSQHQWSAARRALECWSERAATLRAVSVGVAERGKRALDHRNSLRGRLDACQAKAHALGLVEVAALDEIYRQAQAALYHAPTDLDRAGELVHEYHNALSAGGHRE